MDPAHSAPDSSARRSANAPPCTRHPAGGPRSAGLLAVLALATGTLAASPRTGGAPPLPRANQESAPRPSILGNIVKPYSLNNSVLEFRLPDLAGKEHLIAAPDDERVVLLVFWSFRDPVSRFYVPELTRLQERHGDRIALYLVNANADELTGGNADPLDRIRRWFSDEGVKLTLLLDRENRVADDFAAIANGQVFLIDGNQTLRYHGGIDNDHDGKRKEAEQPVTKWLDDALESMLAGRAPEHPWTRPSGRPIKRVKKVGGK